jgi:transcription elongation factor Elf1
LTVGEFRCIECGQLNTVRKAYYTTSRLGRHYSRWNGRYVIKCISCGHSAEFSQRLFDYAKQHDGYFPPLDGLGLNKSVSLAVGVGGNAK